MRARRLAVALAATAAVSSLAGCGGLPVGGGVQVIRPVAGIADSAGQEIRVLPPPPAVGATPDAIVRGFLNAQADGQDDYAIAREYLAPGTTWVTSGPTLVYTQLTVPTANRPGQAVTLTASVGAAASISPDGTYQPQSGTVDQPYQLRRIGGEWRIAALPQGLTLTTGDLQRGFVPSLLWWFTPGFGRLVPEVRWLPQSTTGRQTQLVRALLAGPGPALAPVVRTAVPAGVTLEGSVAQQGATIVVDLSPQAAALSARQARSLLLQLAQTLDQVPTVTRVRLLVDGQPLSAVGVPQSVAIADTSTVSPDAFVPLVPPVAVTDGRIAALPGSGRLPAGALAALRGHVVTHAVPAPDGSAIAADTPGGVLLAAADGSVRTVSPDVAASLSWTLDGRLAVGGPSGLLLVPAAGPAIAVAYPPDLAGQVTAAYVARDGVRVLLVARGAAYVAGISGGQLAARVLLSAGLGTVEGATWQTSSTVALLVRPPGAPLQLTTMAVDGSQASSLALPAGFGSDVTVTAGPGSPLLVGADGVVDKLSGDGWTRLAAGGSPAVAG